MIPSRMLTLAKIAIYHNSPVHLNRHMWPLTGLKNRAEVEEHKDNNGKQPKYKSDQSCLQISYPNPPLRQIHVLTSFRQI
jgi:hypothetical protein